MLVKVRYGESQKYVKVAETEEGYCKLQYISSERYG